MAKHIDLVRYRNDGDDFHILWTARRALRMLDSTSNLVAVSVEGISEQEAENTEKVDAGLLVVDTTEYYGDEVLTEATQVVYYQLKYSTTAPDRPWPLSGLKGTLHGFAERFKELCAQYDPDTIATKVRFRFVSNRPISERVTAAFDAAAASVASGKLNPDVRKMIGKIRRITKLKTVEFKFFAALVDLWGNQETRWIQSANLQAETVRFTPFLDLNVSLKMKELVRSKTTSDAANDKTIRVKTLLRAFGLGNERELLPAEPRFESIAHAIPRAQEPFIIQSILDAQSPVIVHAIGGVGKSIMAQRLPGLLPEGFEAVVFDGFAAGAYRNPRDRRHKHENGLVHIVNDLAKRGLCDILLPLKGSSDEDYLRAFWHRLEQAVAVVRSRSPNAGLIIVLDAADNSVIAAKQYQERCFAPDLLRDVPPEGCRIVALARSHRVDEFLHPPGNAIRILLEPFTIGESAEHLRRRFPEAIDAAVEEFHRLTDKNPRVQANALASAGDLVDLMKTLGPSIQSVEDLIKDQLKNALDKVIEEQASSLNEIKPLCIALAALPPLVPIRVLSKAAGLSEDAIRSFATDFAGGRSVLIHDDAVQFRDEPVETWFRETFAATSDQYSQIVDLLSPIALKDGYVGAALPLLLWGAGRYGDLVDLALRGEGLDTDDPVERREVLLNRVQFALRAALAEKHFEDGVKLLLRIGEEVATNERQAGFLMDNFDLVASLAGPDVVYDFIFRKRAWNLSATPYVYCAAMLAGNQQYRVEAQRLLELSLDWLDQWARMPSDQRQEISTEAIAAYAWTYFHLDGPSGAAGFLARWKPPTVSFKAGGILARRLIDCGNIDCAHELLVAADALRP